MDLVRAYDTSDESDNETSPLQTNVPTSNTELKLAVRKDASEVKENKSDYFGLEESDSEDERILLYERAEQLNDKTFGPELGTFDVGASSFTSKIKFCQKNSVQEDIQVASQVPTPFKTVRHSLKRFHENDTCSDPQKTVVQNVDSNNSSLYKTPAEKIQRTGNDLSKLSVFNISGRNSDDTTDTVNSRSSLFQHHERVLCYINKNNHSKLPRGKFKTFDSQDSCITSLRWGIPQFSHLLLSASLDCKLKVWDFFRGQYLKEVKYDSGIRAAVWSLCGTKVISGGYGKKVHVTDITSGIDIFTQSHPDYVSSVQIHPEMSHVFLSGTKHYVATWDVRASSTVPMRTFESRCGQVLDMIFNKESQELIFTSEIVSRDSADRTVMAWDFNTGALLSNQIFQERYTCPCIKLQPGGKNFIAQTNGSYIAIFSTSRPYKLNKKKRYEGHKVAGYAIQCDFSPDGNYIVSGDAEGRLFFYKTHNAQIAKTFVVRSGSPTLCVAWHPLFYSTIAVGTWAGDVYMWQ